MMFFQPIRGSGAPTLVDQVEQALQAAMESQLLRPGVAVPSVRRFARAHGLSTFTVAAAYGRLAAQGWLTARAGSAYRVAPRAAARPAPPAAPWRPPKMGESWLLADVFADHSIPIKSGCGWLPSEWLNEAGLQQSLRQLARVPAAQIAGYGHPYGYAPLREHMLQVLAERGVAAQPAQILLTQGATQALDIVIRTLFRAGDAVLVELPCYANLLPCLRLAGLEVLGVPRTADGLCIDTLQRLAASRPVKGLFVNTVLHNPTGASLSMANAFQVLQVAERHGFWVIEDDVSRDLLPGIGPMLLALAGTRRVVHVSGFSKSIAPSVRVGYIVAADELAAAFVRTRMAMSLTPAEMLERTVYQVLRQGRHQAHLARVRDRLGEAHETLCGLLDRHGFEVFARPGAGLFLWARPAGAWRERGAARLAEIALRDGIWLAPGGYFDPSGTDAGWLRLNVAYSLDPLLWKFMRRVGAA